MLIGTSNARKQRNAVVVTIPAKFGIDVGQKFYIIQEEDSLRLVPETEDFFVNTNELDEFNEKYVP